MFNPNSAPDSPGRFGIVTKLSQFLYLFSGKINADLSLINEFEEAASLAPT